MSMYIKMNEEQKKSCEKYVEEWWKESTPLQRWQRFELALRELEHRYKRPLSYFPSSDSDDKYSLVIESILCLSMMRKFNDTDETLMLNCKKEINDFISRHEYINN